MRRIHRAGRGRSAALVLVAALLSGSACGGNQEADAIEAANRWLALVDAGQLETSWERAASVVREGMSAADWAATIRAARQPFGKPLSREIFAAERTGSIAGAPDGLYVVIRYRSRFENEQSVVETVTPMREGDEWKVSGYHIR